MWKAIKWGKKTPSDKELLFWGGGGGDNQSLKKKKKKRWVGFLLSHCLGGFIGQSLCWELTQQWSKGSEEFTPHGSFPTADPGWNLRGAAHFLHYCFCSHQDDENPMPTAKVCFLCLYSVSYAQIYVWINNLALQAQEKSLLYFNLQRLLNPDPAGNQ